MPEFYILQNSAAASAPGGAAAGGMFDSRRNPPPPPPPGWAYQWEYAGYRSAPSALAVTRDLSSLPRTNRMRLVPLPALTGRVSSLPPY
jgi:hypothetical protein